MPANIPLFDRSYPQILHPSQLSFVVPSFRDILFHQPVSLVQFQFVGLPMPSVVWVTGRP